MRFRDLFLFVLSIAIIVWAVTIIQGQPRREEAKREAAERARIEEQERRIRAETARRKKEAEQQAIQETRRRNQRLEQERLAKIALENQRKKLELEKDRQAGLLLQSKRKEEQRKTREDWLGYGVPAKQRKEAERYKYTIPEPGRKRNRKRDNYFGTGSLSWAPSAHGCVAYIEGQEAFDGNKVFEKLRDEDGCRRVIFRVAHLSKGITFRRSPCASYGLKTWIEKARRRDLMVYQREWSVMTDTQKPDPNHPFTVRPSPEGTSAFRIWCYEGTDYVRVQ